jgi:hypothetical protein
LKVTLSCNLLIKICSGVASTNLDEPDVMEIPAYEVPDSQPRTQEQWDFYFPKSQNSSSSCPPEPPGIQEISDDEKAQSL